MLSCSLSFILTPLQNEVVKYCKMSFSFASWIFSHEWFQVTYLGQEYLRSDIVSFKRSLILISLITHDVSFDHMVKVLSARILHYKDRFSPFIIKMYFVKLCKYSITHQTLTYWCYYLLTIDYFSMNELWYLPKGDFLIPSFLLHLLDTFSHKEKLSFSLTH